MLDSLQVAILDSQCWSWWYIHAHTVAPHLGEKPTCIIIISLLYAMFWRFYFVGGVRCNLILLIDPIPYLTWRHGSEPRASSEPHVNTRASSVNVNVNVSSCHFTWYFTNLESLQNALCSSLILWKRIIDFHWRVRKIYRYFDYTLPVHEFYIFHNKMKSTPC